MTQYITDFSAMNVGSPPAGWTERWGIGAVLPSVVSAANPISGVNKALYLDSLSATRYLISCDALDGAADIDILTLSTSHYGYYPSFTVYARCGENPSGRFGYMSRRYNGTDRLAKYVNGSYSTAWYTPSGYYSDPVWSNDKVRWIRYRIQGNTHYLKYWLLHEQEPNDWFFSTTNNDILIGGWHGIGCEYNDSNQYCYYVGITDDLANPIPVPNKDLPIFGDDSEGLVWGEDTGAYATLTTINWCWAVGGTFANAQRLLKAIGTMNWSNGDVRAAVYLGGTATSPEGADLLYDCGVLNALIALNGSTRIWAVVPDGEEPAIPQGSQVWLVLKGNGQGRGTRYYTSNVGGEGFKWDNGYFASTAVDLDPGVAFPSTFPSGGSQPNTRRILLYIKTVKNPGLPPIPPPTEVRQAREDISGNDRDLLDAGAVPTGNAQGRIGNAVYFNGSDEQLLTLSSAPDLSTDPDFTIAFRIKPHVDAAPGADIYWHLTIGDLEIRVGLAAGQTDAYISATTPSLSVSSGNVVPADAWSFVTIHFDGSDLHLDINDSEVDSAAGASLGIATPADGIEMGFDGAVGMALSLDEVGIWYDANALTAAQRTTLYSGNYGQRPSFS